MSFSKRLMMLVSKTTLPNQNSWFSHDVIKIKKNLSRPPTKLFPTWYVDIQKVSGSQDVLLRFMKVSNESHNLSC